MPKQHQKVKELREFQRWRRGANTEQPALAKVGEFIDWAIRVCEQADILVNAKGRHNSEVAYRRLEEAVNAKPSEQVSLNGNPAPESFVKEGGE